MTHHYGISPQRTQLPPLRLQQSSSVLRNQIHQDRKVNELLSYYSVPVSLERKQLKPILSQQNISTRSQMILPP